MWYSTPGCTLRRWGSRAAQWVVPLGWGDPRAQVSPWLWLRRRPNGTLPGGTGWSSARRTSSPAAGPSLAVPGRPPFWTRHGERHFLSHSSKKTIILEYQPLSSPLIFFRRRRKMATSKSVPLEKGKAWWGRVIRQDGEGSRPHPPRLGVSGIPVHPGLGSSLFVESCGAAYSLCMDVSAGLKICVQGLMWCNTLRHFL